MSRRSPLTAAIWATALFAAAGIGFAKLAEDLSGPARGTRTLFVVAAAIALIALAAAAAPSAVALARGRDAGAWKYVAVPVAGAAAWYGILRLALALSDGHGAHTGANVTAFVIIAIAGIALLAATAWAAATVLGRVPGDQPVRLRPLAAAIVAAGMAVATIASLVWGLQLRSADPTVFNGDNGLLATPFVPSWIGVVVALAAATVLAVSSARRQPVSAR